MLVRGRATGPGWSTCTPATRCWSAATSPTAASTRCRAAARLIDGIAAERALLTGIAGEADLWVDTSDLNVHQLRATLENAFAREGRTPPLTATVMSFGFKYGLPLDADLVVDARFLPNPHWVPELRPHTGQDADVRDYVLGQPDADGVPRPLHRRPAAAHPRLPAGGQALPDPRRRLHRRQAPQRRDRRGVRPPAHRRGRSPPPPATATWAASSGATRRADRPGWSPSAAATGWPRPWRAWRRLTPQLTAVVTVADDGGSSGRIRREMPVLPPGDLRMALAALAGADERTQELAALLQHRLGGTGVLAGHPVGNLMLTGLAEMHGGDTVRALDALARAARLLRPGAADGRRPAGPGGPGGEHRPRRPGADAHDPRAGRDRGDARAASARSCSPRRTRRSTRPCSRRSPRRTWSRSGPGSWYTSVLPHLLVPAAARGAGRRRRPGWSWCSIWNRSRGRPTASPRRSI